MRRWFLNSQAALLKRKFLLASLKTLKYFKDCTKSVTKISVPAFLLSHWFILSGVHSRMAFGKIFRIRVGFQKLLELKTAEVLVTGSIFTFCK